MQALLKKAFELHQEGRIGEAIPLYQQILVQDMKHQTERMLEFCELPWEEECLAFHQKKRNVRTASNVQVRKPLYASSVNLHSHYNQYFQPLREALAES